MPRPSKCWTGCALALIGLVTVVSTASAGRFRTAIFDPFITPDATYFSKVASTGASVVRVQLDWSSVAPGGPTKPAGFDASDPGDAQYSWSAFDAEIKAAVGAGLQPLVVILGLPQWARGPNPPPGEDRWDPVPAEYGAFAKAAAARYSGSFEGLPRVKLWQAWNEPNISVYLQPQFRSGADYSPDLYRRMVTAFAAAVHGVARSNIVVAGGLSPFTVDYPTVKSIGPLRFMRELLCISAGAHPHRTCKTTVPFDVWSTHPYTSGNAFHHAANPDDVSLGDLPKMRSLLMTAWRLHAIRAPRAPEFWVTEFSWDTNPPDPHAVPLALHARWTAEALYQMWRSGVTLATWWLIQDLPYPQSSYQSGLWFGGSPLATARPKPALQAFRFPFVAYLRSNGVYVWGRTPDSKPASVRLQVKGGGAWKTVALVRADSTGIFKQLVAVKSSEKDSWRAVIASDSSLSFSLKQPPDRFVDAFGGGG
jgi:hypothetical protein